MIYRIIPKAFFFQVATEKMIQLREIQSILKPQLRRPYPLGDYPNGLKFILLTPAKAW